MEDIKTMSKEMLTETYRAVKKLSGIDPSKPGNMKHILVDDAAFTAYVEGLSESITSSKDKEAFKVLAENTRVSLLENSMFQINPYESLTLPILRIFYPKLVAKEAVTVSPMDKPESVKAFIRSSFALNDGTTSNAPSISQDISGSTDSGGTPLSGNINLATIDENGVNIITSTSYAGLTAGDAHLERDFVILTVTDGTDTVSVNQQVAVEGHFSFAVDFATAGVSDVVSGQVDFLNGAVYASTAAAKATSFAFETSLSFEENKVNPRVTLTVDKIRLYAKDRQISANWTINMEQDMRALFDVSMQAEIVNVLGQQIALDIDREIVTSLINTNTRLNPASHRDTFTADPPTTYTWGAKYWHENIIPVLNGLSAQVYNDTHIEAANTILANPLDAALLEDLQGFNYTGTSSVDGDLGYRSATVAGGKWRVLTSAVVPQGTMVVVYKPAEELKAAYIYAPYVPAVLHPYPLGYTPSLTILSRYATACVRPLAISTLTIS